VIWSAAPWRRFHGPRLAAAGSSKLPPLERRQAAALQSGRYNLGRLFIPKSIVCIREGITREQLLRDLMAGVVVGVVALPLALAFAIASASNLRSMPSGSGFSRRERSTDRRSIRFSN
jgi:hypothetical protein